MDQWTQAHVDRIHQELLKSLLKQALTLSWFANLFVIWVLNVWIPFYNVQVFTE